MNYKLWNVKTSNGFDRATVRIKATNARHARNIVNKELRKRDRTGRDRMVGHTVRRVRVCTDKDL